MMNDWSVDVMEFRALCRRFRKTFPLQDDVRIRRQYIAPQHTGLHQRHFITKRGPRGGKRQSLCHFITLDPGLDLASTQSTLAHEWAHALTEEADDKCNKRDGDHGDRFWENWKRTQRAQHERRNHA